MRESTTAQTAQADGPLATESLLVSLQRAVEASTLYVEGHAAIVNAVRAAGSHLGSVFHGRRWVTLYVTRETIELDEKPLGSDRLRPLAAALHAADAAALRLQSDLNESDLAALTRAITRARQGRLARPEFAPEIDRVTGGRARVIPIAYDALTLADGPGEGGFGGAQRISWSALVRALVSGRLHEAAALARAAQDQFERDGGAEAAELRRELERADEDIAPMPLGERVRSLQRLNAFLGAVSPRLRGALEAAPRWRERSAFALLLELSGVTSLDAVLDAMQKVDEHSQAPMREVLVLFDTLAQTVEPGARDRIGGLEKQWREAAAAAAAADANLDSSLEEILESREPREFTPDDYRSQLERLGRLGPEARGRPLVEAPSTGEMRGHMLAICGLVAAEEPFARRCPGLFATVGESVPDLVERGDLETLMQTASAARVCIAGDPARDAAAAFLGTLADAARVEKLARDAIAGGPCGARALALLRASGPVALRPLASLAAVDPGGEIAVVLRALAAVASDAQLAELTGLLDPQDPRTYDLLLGLYAGQPPDRLPVLMAPVLSHRDDQVRHRAFRVLGRLSPSWPTPVARMGIEDASDRIQRLTIAHLGSRCDSEAIGLLAGIVESAGVGPVRLGRFDAAVAALAGSQDGLVRLASSLRQLNRSMRPRRAWYAARLARVLRRHRATPRVDEAVRRWRRSPIRWLSLIGADGPPLPETAP